MSSARQVAVLIVMKEKKKGIERHVVKCPHCGKDVLDHFTECPHCKGKLESAYYDTTNLNSAGRQKLRAIYIIITVFIVVAIVIWRSIK